MYLFIYGDAIFIYPLQWCFLLFNKYTYFLCLHKSPIRTVIVSQGDVSDFHHIQGVVGDFNAVRIQNVGVFLSPSP